jgi:hypothetical protein
VKQIGIDLGKCALGEVPAAVQAVLPDVENAIQGTPTTWNNEIAALESEGMDLAVCAVSAIVHRLMDGHASLSIGGRQMMDRARQYLLAHGHSR